MKPTIKELIAGNSAWFHFYRAGHFYYYIFVHKDMHEIGEKWEFPIPADDIGSATLNSCEKAITLMRWIRKAISDKTLIRLT